MEKRTYPVLICGGLLIVLMAEGCPRTSQVSDTRLPARKGVVLLFKALTYDGNLTASRKRINIAIVYAAGNEDSIAHAKEMLAEMQGVRNIRVRGLKIFPSLVASDGKRVNTSIEKGANLLYLSSGLEGQLEALCSVGTRYKALVVTGEEAYVRSCAGLGLVRRGKKAKVLLNLKGAKAQGSSFDERLLRVAEISH